MKQLFRRKGIFCITVVFSLLSLISNSGIASAKELGSISVLVFTDGDWESVYIERRNVHMKDFYGDGALALTSVEKLVTSGGGEHLPEYVLNDEFACKVVSEAPYDSCETKFYFYLQDGDELNKLENETNWEALEDGRYLIEVNCSNTLGEYYFSGSALFWLLVGTAE